MISRRKHEQKAYRRGFAMGMVLTLALFSYTITETALAILWWIV